LNPIAAILTIIAFAIAVHVIREEDGKRLGRNTLISLLFAIFPVTLLQAMLALFSPTKGQEEYGRRRLSIRLRTR
jgi:hypothetical protein